MPRGDRKHADTRLAVELASGKTVETAAEAAGLSVRTAFRRLRDPAFAQQVREARAAFVDRAVGKLADASTKAVDTLVQLLDCDTDTVKLGACRAILELGNRLRESVELEQRISELETRVSEKPQQ